MNKNDVRIFNYCDYSSNNYGSSRAVQIGSLTLYFSYDTIIAFNSPKNNAIRENSWSSTTGKHLNAINPNHSVRLDSEKFEKELDEVLECYQFREVLKH